MKLFKSLLVAPAMLGLLAPLAANATEVNLNDISNYSSIDEEMEFNSKTFDKNSKVNLLAGGEGMVSGGGGGFSTTTSASFSADFAIGAVDGLGITTTDKDNGKEAVTASYGFQIDLTTSFTGEDSLDISIDAGNSLSGANPLGEFDLNGSDDKLTIDGVAYTFPIGDKTTVIVGAQGTDGSAAFTTACTYGGPSNTLDDCGNVQSNFDSMTGSSLGASYALTDGLSVALGYAGNGATAGKGLMTDEGADAWGANVAYLKDTYGVSATYAYVENAPIKDFVSYSDGSIAFNGYYAPEGFPSISAGYEYVNVGSQDSSYDKKESVFVGLQFDDIFSGSAGVAFGTQGSILEGDKWAYMTEVYYSYPLNDGMTITPLVYFKDATSATGTARNTDKEETGVMVKTSFSF